ncbi:hypothetical protein K8R47_02955 [archaeon]|nr:hypothetical protein [archaeon]
MVHKRYIKRDGKVYGPYFYKSVRSKDGKVKNIYLGDNYKEKNDVVQKNHLFTPLLLVTLMFVMFGYFIVIPFTGFDILEIGNDTLLNEEIKQDGEIKGIINLEKEEEIVDIVKEEIKPVEEIKIIDEVVEDIVNEHFVEINSKENVNFKGLTYFPRSLNLEIKKSNDLLRTNVVALEDNIEFDEAEITLKKYNRIDYIMYCSDFDFDEFGCTTNWDITNIPFVDNGDTITFTVEHFTAYGGGGENNSNLTIYSDTDLGNIRYSNSQFYFYANYTNATNFTYIPNANCTVNFNATGSWSSLVFMNFGGVDNNFAYNQTINNKGIFSYNVTCNSTEGYDTVWVDDTATVANSQPIISDDAGGKLPMKTCTEDTVCTYNFTANVSDVDQNDVLNYSYEAGSEFTGFSIDGSTGIVTVNVATDNTTGYFEPRLTVTDSDNSADITTKPFNITKVNDIPDFALAVCSTTGVEDTEYYCDLSGNDEEDGGEDTGNLTFKDNATLFNITSNTGIINFTPLNSDVGVHSFNITLNDSFGLENSSILVVTINNSNDLPNLTDVCQNLRNATEDIEFNCYINASDLDITENLTFGVNVSWFEMNITPQLVVNGNASTLVNFTPNDTAVGNHSINITVTDSSGAIDSEIISFNVTNVNDIPNITNMINMTAYGGVLFEYDVNATDDDQLNIYNDTLTFDDNTTLFNISSSGLIKFTPNNGDAGTYWVNITVNDSVGAMDSEVINFTIYSNTGPMIDSLSSFNATEDIEFYYNFSANVSDSDSDTLTYTDNSSLFDINSTSGEINFTANDTFVGENWMNITVTDAP